MSIVATADRGCRQQQHASVLQLERLAALANRDLGARPGAGVT